MTADAIGHALAVAGIGLLTLAMAVWGGSLVTVRVLRRAGRRIPAEHAGESRPAADAPTPSDRATPDAGDRIASAALVLRGGAWIGGLERLAIAGALLLGNPAAIALVVAVKGLGRYPELKENPEASERFVIGTLASMLWAAAAGAAGAAAIAAL